MKPLSRPLVLVLLFAALSILCADRAHAQASGGCSTPSNVSSNMIDTILAGAAPSDLPISVDLYLDNGVGLVPYSFTANGSTTVVAPGSGHLVHAVVAGTTVCHGSSTTVNISPTRTALVAVGTSPVTGRSFVNISVNSFQ